MSTEKKDAVAEPRTMTIQDVAEALQCSDRHIFNMRRDGRIPPPGKTGKEKGVRWPCHVIDDWIRAGFPALAV